jgi:hypothetical protein
VRIRFSISPVSASTRAHGRVDAREHLREALAVFESTAS